MALAHSIRFPGSRVLAGWWRRLAPLNPVGLWIGNFLFHNVEAPVQAFRLTELPRFARFILQGLDCSQDRTITGLASHLMLDDHVLLQLLRSFEWDKLVEAEQSRSWRLNEKGKRALQEGNNPTSHVERRLFTFVQMSENKNASYIYFHKNTPAKPPSSLPPKFEVAWLTECLNQTPEWKKRRQFPEDVFQLLTSADRGASASTQQPKSAFSNSANQDGMPTLEGSVVSDPIWDWQCIILAQAWRQTVAIALTRDAGHKECLLGFPVEGPQWDLDEKKPMITLFDGWREVFDELTAEPTQELWVQAWRDWCQPRGLQVGDTFPGSMDRAGHKIRVEASRRLMEQLRSQRSDALKGEAWLLAGTGELRTARLLQILERKPARQQGGS